MGDKADQDRWRQFEREAKGQGHTSAEHANWRLAGLLEACEKMLLATEVIADPNGRLALIDNLYTAIRRTVNQGETMDQLEFEVRAIWEVRHGT